RRILHRGGSGAGRCEYVRRDTSCRTDAARARVGACGPGGAAMNATTPTLEFLRVAQLAKQTTGLTPAADTSTHDTRGLWQLSDADNETICEVSPDGTVVESQVEAPPFGLLDRIRDLRACGCSTRAIHGWFGTPRSVDELMEARVVFNIAMGHMAAMSQPCAAQRSTRQTPPSRPPRTPGA